MEFASYDVSFLKKAIESLVGIIRDLINQLAAFFAGFEEKDGFDA